MLPLNETIKDVETWTSYIREDAGAIPAGLQSAVVYLQTLRAIIDGADKKDQAKQIREFRDWLEKKGYYNGRRSNEKDISKRNEKKKKRPELDS